MKKSTIILITIIAVVVVAITSLVVWQYQNITAVIEGLVYDEQQMEQKTQQSEQDVKDYLESNNIGTVRPLTEEEAAAVTSGEITEQDAVKIVTGSLTLEQAKQNKTEQNNTQQNNTEQNNTQQNTSPQNNGQQKPAGTSQPSDDNTTDEPDAAPEKQPETNSNTQPEHSNTTQQKPQAVDYDALISEKVAQLYVVKANFYAEFNSAWAAEKAAYLALPKEQRGKGKIAEIVRSKMSEGMAMEQKYDAQVDTIVSELKQLLTEAGRSTELADAVKNAYNQEKKAKKAQLINKYFG